MSFLNAELKTYLKYGILGGLVLSVSLTLGLLSVFFYQVYFGDDTYLKKTTIMAKINEETSIYYMDGETRLGSFFEQQHRRYVPIEEIPAHMINAIVASEDKYFYGHSGINPIAVFKAMGEGLQLFLTSGQIRFRGGSTITQQTVKNILDRKEYSLKRKFREAIAAMQLETLYNKRQILEFYFNQFHVASNGNGIGIAAQYYFNKDVRDIGLVEAAFIAGSVKGPSKYNPFIQYTPEARQQAWGFANERKNYVLKQMFEQGWINETEFKEAYTKPVPFKKGTFTSREVALVSLIRSQMDRKEILEAVGIETIEDLKSAGLKIVTTLDADIQKSGQLMMRRNLSRLETILQGFKGESPEHYKALRDLEVGEFYYAKVEKVVQKNGQYEVLLDYGLPKAVLRHDSLVRYAKLMDIAVPQGYPQRLKELVAALKPGTVVFTEVREYDATTHQAVVEMQKRAVVNGAMVVIDHGEMRAVVSGFDSQGYNRAIFGKRQPGSVFKSVSYFAALQLGWSILDPLDNERRLYPYQGQFYYPRPDHDSPYEDVSMIWAGTKSENLASIFLTAKLVEKLSLEQFKGVMGLLGLLPTDGENKRDYHYRVARKIGVQLDNEGIKEFELGNAIADVSSDLIFNGDQDTMRRLQKMWWGRGYAAELQRLYATNDEEFGEKEKTLRISLVKNNYQRHSLLAAQLEVDWEKIKSTVETKGTEGTLATPELRPVLSRFRVVLGRGNRPALGYYFNPPEESVSPLMEPNSGRALNGLDIQSIWGAASSSIFASSANISLGDVKLLGYLSLDTFRKLQTRLDQRYNNVLGIQEAFDLPQYFHHHDFRIAIGLTYLKKLCEQMGVFSQIEPVLSFPLGTNVVSVAEVAKIYQTFTEGKIYRFYKEGPPNQLNFIKRIEDREGNVLFEPQRSEHQLVDLSFAEGMQQILRKVITHGTGSRARGELYLKLANESDPSKYVPIRIPAFGKTGTTNDYTTASFAGFIPYPAEKNAILDPKSSYVISAYVGYDFNKEMVRGGFKVGGSQGALPMWTDLGKDIIEQKKYVDYLDKLDLKTIARQEWPLKIEKDSAIIKVDIARGVMLRQDENLESEVFATTDIGVTGEEFVNEFANNASVKSAVRVPIDTSSGSAMPLRAVTPFHEFKTEEQLKAEKEAQVDPASLIFSSKVDPNASASSQQGIDANSAVIRSNTSTAVQAKPESAPVERAVGPETKVSTEAPKAVTSPTTASPSTDDLLKEIESQQEKSGNAPPVKPNPEQNKSKEGTPGYTEEELW